MPLYEYRNGVLKPVVPIRMIRQEVPAPVVDCVLAQPVADFKIADSTIIAESPGSANDFVSRASKAYSFVDNPDDSDYIEI